MKYKAIPETSLCDGCINKGTEEYAKRGCVTFIKDREKEGLKCCNTEGVIYVVSYVEEILKQEVCKWKLQDKDECHEDYMTSHKRRYINFIDLNGDYYNRNVKYCPYCGKPIEIQE